VGNVIRSRRDRLRAETIAEIKATALRHLATGGVAAISLRAIARDMGMTAGALYSYYDTREDLITALVADVYQEMTDAEQAAARTVPVGDPAGKIIAVGLAYREWAVGNPAGFQLIFGEPIPGYRIPPNSAAAQARDRACALLDDLVAEAWPYVTLSAWGRDYTWSDFQPHMVATIRRTHPELPPAALALALRIWGRMHGLVMLEITGHLGSQTTNPAKLFRNEMLDLTRDIGLPPPTVPLD